jgi:acetyl-CoA carboxylase carboxyl transferase subunit alpha
MPDVTPPLAEPVSLDGAAAETPAPAKPRARTKKEIALAGGPWLDFEKPVVELEQKIAELKSHAQGENLSIEKELAPLEARAEKLRHKVYDNLTRYQRVQLARHPRRPYLMDYVERLLTDWTELHGDRGFADDRAIVGGLGRFEGEPLLVVGTQKGRDTKENLLRRFGMPNPEGYRKALRLMKLAERFRLPVVTLVDTPGAYPGLGAEERGQAEAIAVNLREMARLEIPVVTVVIGEGGSGGALALAVSDVVLVFENSIYSVISPEGCASILWRDGKKAPLAAAALGLTAPDLLRLGVVDDVLPEPLGGAHRDPAQAAATLKKAIAGHLDRLAGVANGDRVDQRIRKYRKMGVFRSDEA